MKLVCLGDSLTYGYKVKLSETWPSLVKQKLNIEVVNKGINGDTTGGMLGRYSFDVMSESPSHVIIMGGGNDLIWGVPLSVVEANLVAMVQQALHNQIVPIIAIPIPFSVIKTKKYWPYVSNFDVINQNIKEYREWILTFTKNFSVHVLDFYELFIDYQCNVRHDLYSDGIHPTANGNKIMSDIVVQKFIMEFGILNNI
ncbi:GDSL-type esterase/lipase family protein [Desulfosporosinus sp. BICA1-9]|uniref:GDSL-type esterase/lipase family protein n=1 Tax=Desulfosporosinus sp. BICA1-9 TaxID=1531958 RepID=UPI00054B573F|nr:GDSL-type esterase/lipase family protein [Desulfosporosinus sp. BICA1-9]KJS82806.1 MAG: hypothetical protein JL57_23550 [Desulfosporosinus sp. BICA1-9]